MKILELSEYHELFEIDSIHYDEDIENFVSQQNPSVIFINKEGVNTYSGKSPLCPNFPWFSKF
jgi:Xaa-Pro dipeptidase